MTDHTPDVLDVFDAVTVAAEAANGTSCHLWEDAFLEALTDAGYVIVRDPSGLLRHGDEMEPFASNGTLKHADGFWRAEPVQPAKCETCNGTEPGQSPVADDACGFCSGGPAGPNPDCPHHAPEDVK